MGTTEEVLKDADKFLKPENRTTLIKMQDPLGNGVAYWTLLSGDVDNMINLIAELSAKLRESEEERCYHHKMKITDGSFVQCQDCWLVWDAEVVDCKPPTPPKKEDTK